jgi:hypothetical protein
MRLCISGLGLSALLLLGASLAYGQQHQVRVGDDGQVLPRHQHMHAKAGHKINWARASGASKTWYVKFDDSPCAEGNEFGSDRAKTCTINVACKAAGDPGCKAYAYQSATGPNATANDPDIIIDP